MIRVLIVILIFSILSCKDERQKRYDHIVDRSDSIVIKSRERADSIVVSILPDIDSMKQSLKNAIRPELPRKFIADQSIVLYEQGREIGVLMISAGSKGYVNFHSDGLTLSFPVTADLRNSLEKLALNKNQQLQD